MAILPQRPLRGSRISSFYPVKSLPSLASLDSAFQLQEYISLLIRLDVHDVEAITSLPGKRVGKEKESDVEGEKSDARDDGEDGDERGKNEPTVDEACWIYEQLRRLAQDLTHPLITMLQQECTRASCPEMKAGEWLYLCVAHGTDGNVEQCCAIDYILHTLDSATALLNTPRAFPSRIQIPQSSHRHFSSLARRLGRIFAHAYFHHREAFEQAEAESSLYARFLSLTSKFDLVPAEFLVIPTHSSSDSDSDRETDDRRDAHVPRLLAAAVEPQAQRGGGGPWVRSVNVNPVELRAKSASPPGMNNGRESPRKLGRNRTDTMVLHDAYAVTDELAKASPKVPSLDDIEEPMSPMDADELPEAAKPAIESLEEIGNSLPESPILHSPPPPSGLALPTESRREILAHQEEPPSTASAIEHPAAILDTELTTAEESALEADIAEIGLSLTGVETIPSIADTKSVVEDVPKEIEEVVKEAEPPKELVSQEIQEETEAEKPMEIVPELEPAVMEASTETHDVPVEVPPAVAGPEHAIEVAPAESTPPPAHVDGRTTVPTETMESEVIVEIPDEGDSIMEVEEVESTLQAEGEAKEKEVEVEEKAEVEIAGVPAEEKEIAPAMESDHAPSSESSL